MYEASLGEKVGMLAMVMFPAGLERVGWRGSAVVAIAKVSEYQHDIDVQSKARCSRYVRELL